MAFVMRCLRTEREDVAAAGQAGKRVEQIGPLSADHAHWRYLKAFSPL